MRLLRAEAPIDTCTRPVALPLPGLTSRSSVSTSGNRRLRHCLTRTESSISTMFNHISAYAIAAAGFVLLIDYWYFLGFRY